MSRKMVRAEELCTLNELSRQSLIELQAVGLLKPNGYGEYRSKLVVWARKLAYLLDAGWTLPENKTWARVRWSTPNTRKWPPDGRFGTPNEGWNPQEAQANSPTRVCDDLHIRTGLG